MKCGSHNLQHIVQVSYYESSNIPGLLTKSEVFIVVFRYKFISRNEKN